MEVLVIKNIIHGNEREANASNSSKRGWVVGHMHQEDLAGTKDLEIKLWRYDGPINYGRKSFNGTEFIVIYGGKLRFDIEDETGAQTSLTLCGEENEYVIFPPGLKKVVVVESAPAHGVTVRWPSLPGINKVVT